MLSDIKWYDHESAPMWLDYVGIGLTILGFVIAIRQLYKVQGAKSAAEGATADTTNHFITNQFLTTAERFRGILGDLQGALDQSDRTAVIGYLSEFVFEATSAADLMDAMEVEGRLSSDQVRDAANEASLASHNLRINDLAQINGVTNKALLAITTVTPSLDALGKKIRNKLPRTSEGKAGS